MRIVVISDKYPPAAVGGYELSCHDVVTRWRAAGDEVTVLTTAVPPGTAVTSGSVGSSVGSSVDAAGVVRRLPWAGGPRRQRMAVQRRAASVVAGVLRRQRPDVVSCWNLGKLPLAVLHPITRAGVPVVLVVCDGWLAAAPGEDPWAAWWASRPGTGRRVTRLSGLPTAVAPLPAGSIACYVSGYTRRATQRSAPPWAPASTAIVASGVDPVVFPPTADSGRPWRGRLLFAGRPVPAKGVGDVVDALAHLPATVSLRIVGPVDPGRLRALQAHAERRGVAPRVTFARTDRQGLRAEYLAADAVVFASRWAEPFGLVPLEAMACATPVVATGTGGSGEYLRDGHNCLLVAPEDPGAVAAAVRRLAADAGLRARLVRNGAVTAASYGIDRTATGLADQHRAAVQTAAVHPAAVHPAAVHPAAAAAPGGPAAGGAAGAHSTTFP